MVDFEAIVDPELSTESEPRYSIINPETKEILDNADGRGYKYSGEAILAYVYKNHLGERKVESLAVVKWYKSHMDFIDEIDQELFEVSKGNRGKDTKFDTKYLEKMLRDHGYTDLPFSAHDLMAYWIRH